MALRFSFADGGHQRRREWFKARGTWSGERVIANGGVSQSKLVLVGTEAVGGDEGGRSRR